MNRHSIFFKLTTVFILMIVTVILVFFLLVSVMMNRQHSENEKRDFVVHRVVNLLSKQENLDALKLFLKERSLEIVEKDKEEILKKGEKITLFAKEKKIMDNFRSKEEEFDLPPPPHRHPISAFFYKGDRYIHTQGKNHDLLLKDGDRRAIHIFWLIIGIALILIIILIIAYVILRNNLKKLKLLQRGIESYARGEINEVLQTEGEDEISALSNAFYNTLHKIVKLQESRKFLLRNMMHELKTPLTKSKLYTAFLEEGEAKDKLDLSLNKLELLMNEMADIERISSNNISLDKKTYRVVDIVDEVIDALFTDNETVNVSIDSDVRVEVDFKLFSIALKNLVDNGIKYSPDNKASIQMEDKRIEVYSKGDPLTQTLEKYTEPFYKGELSEKNNQSFGLGLYIVSEVLKKHRFPFSYRHENEANIFSILLIPQG